METDTKLQKQPFRTNTTELFAHILANLSEGLTGIAASDKKDWALSLGHLLQRIRGGQFLETVAGEWNTYRSRGKIKNDYQFCEQHQACLQEMLDFLDKDSPDEIRFATLKKVFLVAASETLSDRDSLLPQQYMRICRNLSSGEVILLATAYEIQRSEIWSSRDQWITRLAQQSGLKHTALVLAHENTLIQKHLIAPPVALTNAGQSEPFLTDLGYDLCRFINAYENIKPSDHGEGKP